MYMTHTQLDEISDDSILWRYMDLLKFINIFTTNKIWFNRIDKFEDVYEGTFPTANEKYRDKYYPEGQIPKEIYNQIEKCTQSRLFVYCLHENDYESAAMWSLYGKENGLAIKTTGKNLKECFSVEQENIYITKVSYIDYEKDFLPEGNAFYLGTHKRKSFYYENEIRGLCLIQNRTPSKEEAGIYIAVDIAKLIQEIYISPYAPSYMVDTVKNLLERYKYSIPVIKSSLYKTN